MFEKLRSRWTRITHPLVVRMGNLDPSFLTWSSLVLAIISFYIIAGAEMDSGGAIGIVFAIILILLAAVLDALDGALGLSWAPFGCSWGLLGGSFGGFAVFRWHLASSRLLFWRP